MRETTPDSDGKYEAGKRFERGGRAGYHGAGGYRGRVLQNRIPPRAAGAQRVCASVRTHDVSGLRERAEDATHQAGQFQWRRAERLDELRRDELLRSGPFECAGTRAVARSGSDARFESGRLKYEGPARRPVGRKSA